MNRIQIEASKKLILYYENYILAYYNRPTKLKELGRPSSYAYNFSYFHNSCNFLEGSIQEIYNLLKKDKLITPNSININAGDKIFFSDSTFPSLLLSRTGVNLKRTTKIDSANLIVSDCTLRGRDCFKNLALIDTTNNIIVFVYINSRETCKQFTNRMNDLITKMKQLFNYDLKLYLNINPNNYDAYEQYLKQSSKLITTEQLTKYVLSQLPVLQQSECDNICDMLKSSDESTIITGLGTLQYYNFADCCVDILGALINSQGTLPSNREAEYIYSLLNVSKSRIIDIRYSSIQNKIHLFMDTLNKFVVTPSMSTRQKVYTILRGNLFDEIQNKYKEELSRLNVNLSLIPTDDTNGEATTSTSTVEEA